MDIQENGKISCVHGLDELILLKRPYYLYQCSPGKQSIICISLPIYHLYLSISIEIYIHRDRDKVDKLINDRY